MSIVLRIVASFGRPWLSALVLACVAGRALAQSDQFIYTDSLQPGWDDWSWSATRNFASTGTTHSGSAAISVAITASYGALSLHHNDLDTSSYTNLTFWVHGGSSGGQLLQMYAELSSGGLPSIALPPLVANTWQQLSFSLAALGVANQPNFSRFSLQDRSGAGAATFYLDDIKLTSSMAPPVTNTAVALTVDAQANRHPISPLIYGVAYASAAQVADLNTPLNRSGGNAETRYNWQLNAHNHGADWYFESLDDGSATPGASADTFVGDTKGAGAEPMLTIPMIGSAPRLGAGRARLSSYSIGKYGSQTGSDWQWFADAGNGVGTNPATHTTWLITTNNVNDANFITNSAFQQPWLQHLTNRWGLASNGGVRYYLMDNEHSIWHGTHRDVHPVGATMQEIRDKFFDYAGLVKGLDPAALVLAPEEWGWSGYLYSGYDQQYGGQHGWSGTPDRDANGGWDYMPWLLDQFRQRATSTGQRLLDYFTLHCYPQGGESGNDVSASMQLLRNRSTRQLWDTNYVDASWINSVVMLIPRMKNWVAAYYPGTKTGITEYNWGAEGSINGATAQADILGIFGREGLDLATHWTTPDASTPTYKAMKLYRNCDGNKSGFGDTSVSVTAPNPDTVSAFAAVRSTDSALTLMVINKQLTATATLAITLTNFPNCGAAQVWQLTSANTLTRLADLSFGGSVLTNLVPAQSVTLFVLPAPPRLRPGALGAGNTFDFWLDGQAGQRYVIQATTNLLSWLPMATNTPSSNSWHVVLPATGTHAFYRAKWGN
jgi:hypothetical protein